MTLTVTSPKTSFSDFSVPLCLCENHASAFDFNKKGSHGATEPQRDEAVMGLVADLVVVWSPDVS